MNRYLSVNFIYLVLSFLLVMILMFYGASQILAFFQTATEKVHDEIFPNDQVSRFYQPKLTSLDVGKNEGRQMEASTLIKVNQDYLASYYYHTQSLQTGQEVGLKDYYTRKARQHISKQLADRSDQEVSFQGTTIEHFSKINFYSEDGTLISLSDEVISYQEWQNQDNQPIVTHYDTSAHDMMLLLEDNFWRVRHKVRTRNQLKLPDSIPLKKESTVVSVKNDQILLDGKPFTIRAINYYPQEHPWQKMWEDFGTWDLSSDFKKIKELGFNSLRIFIPYDHFGRAEVRPSEMLKLTQFMDAADKHSLKVIVTLFDFFLSYSIKEWTLADRHAESIINSLAEHRALLAWDIKNEPDLDYENLGQNEVNRWLEFMIKRVRRYDPNTLITIGWSQPEFATILANEMDFLSFHFYRAPIELSSFLKINQFKKPLFLGETGKHTFRKWWFPFSQTQQDQKTYYEEIFKIADQYNLNYGLWTLYDFPEVPENVAGQLPWQINPQKAYGLMTKKGKKKSSYDLIKEKNHR